jgi:hypothetical protein
MISDATVFFWTLEEELHQELAGSLRQVPTALRTPPHPPRISLKNVLQSRDFRENAVT